MNKYFKEFLHRGLMFGGFGPVIVGVIFAILDGALEDFSLSGGQILLAIVSTYLLAFVQAGASVFNGIESWSLAKSLGLHFLTLYVAYSTCYVVNSWIPFEPMVLVIFTAIFAVTYFFVWFLVYSIIKATERGLNKRIGNK